jgi:transposase InsO family protein
MRTRTEIDQREQFYRLHQAGSTYLEISQYFRVSKECVRYWCRRQRDGKGCQSHYSRARKGFLSRFDAKVRFVILRLRLHHPRWGPNRILARLRKRPSLRGLRLPDESSIGRYLHQWPKFRRSTNKKRPAQRPNQPIEVHQRWQIDFKLGIELQEGTRVNLHTVRDPVGEACIGAFVYLAPADKLPKHVPMEEVRATLRACFAHWGTLPAEIQTDGEATLVAKTSDLLPSEFTLWLMGLGIVHLVIRSGVPTDNAEVERCHRTIHEYAILGNEKADLEKLQQILDESLYELNYELPSWAADCAGQPPIRAHPELLQPLRPYRPELELAVFDLKRVDAFLTSLRWERKVDINGVIYLGKRYYLGAKYARRTFTVRFDPVDRQFVCYDCDANGEEEELRRWPVQNLEIADLTGLIEVAWPTGLGPQQLRLPLKFAEEVNC